MGLKFQASISTRDITPEEVFYNRRHFMKTSFGLGLIAGSTVWCGPVKEPAEEEVFKVPFQRTDIFPAARNTQYRLPESIDKELTPRLIAASHNNYYEFLPGKGGPVYKHTDKFKVVPWKVEITGECNNPMTLDLDDLFKFEHEERLYHFRCVERWAMNVPWSGFPLRKLIEKADPKGSARFVRFTTVNRPKEMPGMSRSAHYPWPYVEALRLDEAMNELAMAVTGVYGKPLPIQHGAPIRIIVPWKYGYKNPKSVVKIEFLRNQPKTFWMIQPHEYGFLSNVNPNIPHPRWSQERSTFLQREGEWFPTPIFNGYEAYVAGLYPDEPRTPQAPLRQGSIAR